jgi:tetratricopeptide (TPR) repeat protein
MREIMNYVKKLCMLCLPWFLVACGTIPTITPVPDTNQPPVSSMPSEVKAEPKAESPSGSNEVPKVEPKPVDGTAKAPAAVASLLERAKQQELKGDYQAAVASLERAIRIAPRYPESYYRLGELRLKQGLYRQARSLGHKTLSLGADWWLRRQAQSLVDRASAQ